MARAAVPARVTIITGQLYYHYIYSSRVRRCVSGNGKWTRNWRQVVVRIEVYIHTLGNQADGSHDLTEQAESMKVILPGQDASLDGLIELLVPRFELLWGRHKHEFGG
jgi:hypothetical protein